MITGKAPRLKSTNVYLVGMMGSGKTTIGEALARGLGSYTFLDLDHVIESAAKCPIHELFTLEGEEAFRGIESATLNQVKNYIRCVVSTGGGTVKEKSNWRMMQTGVVVYLDVDVDILASRLTAAGVAKRPLLSTGEDPKAILAATLTERERFYNQADVAVKITQSDSPSDVVVKIADAVHTLIDENPPDFEKNKEKAKSEGIDWV